MQVGLTAPPQTFMFWLDPAGNLLAEFPVAGGLALCCEPRRVGRDMPVGLLSLGLSLDWPNEQARLAVPHELKRPYKFGGGALVASGVLFVLLALLDLRAGPPPSSGAEILLWRDSHALVLSLVSECLFFATILLVPATIALYQSLVDVDRTKAATGCGIIAATVPVMAVMLIVHGRLVYPIHGMRVDTPEAATLVVIVFYGGLHAIYLLLAVATIILSSLTARATDSPLSSHPPLERLSREPPAVDHGDRCNDDPQRGGQHKVTGPGTPAGLLHRDLRGPRAGRRRPSLP